MHEQLSNFNSHRAFWYQAYTMYLILNQFFIYFQSLLDPKDLIPYGIVSIIHKAPFLRNHPTGFVGLRGGVN